MKPYVETTETIEVRLYEPGGEHLYDIHRTKDPYDALAWLCGAVSNYGGVKAYANIEKRINPKSFYAYPDEDGKEESNENQS